MDYLNTTTINNLEVAISIEGNFIEFTINESYDWSEEYQSSKVAIVRWLLKEWSIIKPLVDYLWCMPCDDDADKEESKLAIYRKLGFFESEGKEEYLDITAKLRGSQLGIMVYKA